MKSYIIHSNTYNPFEKVLWDTISAAPAQNWFQQAASAVGNFFSPGGGSFPIPGQNPNPIQAMNYGLTGATPQQLQSTPYSNTQSLGQHLGTYSPTGAYSSGSNQNYSPLPANTGGGSSGGGSGDSQIQQLQKMQQSGGLNPAQQSQLSQLMSQQNNAAAGNTQAQIQAAINSYNAMQNQLEAQKPVIQNAYNTANAGLQQQLDTGVQQGNQSQGLLTSQNNAALGQLGQNYQTSQGENRELARSLGSFGTDYAQLVNRSNNNFQNNQTQMNNDYQTRSTAIQQGLQSLQNWGVAQKANLSSQYQAGLQQIVLSETANDAQKAQAVTQLKAALGDKLASIQNTVFSLGAQIATQQLYNQNYMTMLGRQTANFDPFATANNPIFATLGLSDNSGQQAAGGINNTNNNQTAGTTFNPNTGTITPQQVFGTSY